MQVEVRGIDGELKQLAEECITIRPNFSYTLQEIQENAMRVFSTNYFRSLSPRTKVTQDGVKLIFNVRLSLCLRHPDHRNQIPYICTTLLKSTLYSRIKKVCLVPCGSYLEEVKHVDLQRRQEPKASSLNCPD